MLCFPISVPTVSRPAGRRTSKPLSQVMAPKTLKLQNDLPVSVQFGGIVLANSGPVRCVAVGMAGCYCYAVQHCVCV